MRRLVVMGIATLTLGACSFGAQPTQTVTDAASTPSPAAPVAVPSPTPSATPTDPPPEIDLTADDGDYRRVVEEVLRFRAWLFAHPHRQDQISRIYDPDCPCHEGLAERLQAYVDAERRMLVQFPIDSFELVGSEDLLFRAHITWRVVGQVLNSSGDVVEQGETEAVSERWAFFRDSDGAWRVISQRRES